MEELHRRLGAPVVRVDPRHGIGDADLARAVAQSLGRPPLPARPRPDLAGDELASADERFAWIQDAIDAATVSPQAEPRTWSDRIDRWVTAPWLGPIIFLAVMWVVFQLTTTAAAPLQDGLDALFSGPVSTAAVAVLARSDSVVPGSRASWSMG